MTYHNDLPDDLPDDLLDELGYVAHRFLFVFFCFSNFSDFYIGIPEKPRRRGGVIMHHRTDRCFVLWCVQDVPLLLELYDYPYFYPAMVCLGCYRVIQVHNV